MKPVALMVALAATLIQIQMTARSSEVSVPAQNRTALAVTVYNDGQALVRDTRRLQLPAGLSQIALRDVAATIRAETASLKVVAGQPLTLLEQNYEFDLLTPAALLRKYVGQEVSVLRTNPSTGLEISEKATVLATNDGIVLRYADRIETGIAGRIAFGQVPANLRDRPTLTMVLNVAEPGQREVELTYLANQIQWKADYIANVSRESNSMLLNGLVTLTNTSGADYENAQLQLVAGTLNRVRDTAPSRLNRLLSPSAERLRNEVAQEKLGDFHLYTLHRPTSILNNQTKQVALLTADQVPVSKEYVVQTPGAFWWYQRAYPEMQKGIKPSVFLRFENKGTLGMPMPAGVVRVYTTDSRGGAQFIGEDAITHTAQGEKLALRLGEAFDITADRVQTNYQVVSPTSSKSSYRIEVRNADKTPVTVTIREPLQGDWRITAENLKHAKESAGTAVWQLSVPAEGTATLEYTAAVRW